MLNKVLRMSYKVVEIRESGSTVTHYLRGSKANVQKDIQMFKENSKRYEDMGKEGMIIWV